jgi:hypothetical protein
LLSEAILWIIFKYLNRNLCLFSEISPFSAYISLCVTCCEQHSGKFWLLLNVHLSIFISVINQLDAQNFCFTRSLFHASTCFEHNVLIIRRSKLYYTRIGVMIPEAV